MPTRTIKTTDSIEHSGDSVDFTDYYSYVEYRDSSETKRIYRNNIIFDKTTKNWNETMMPIKIGIITGIITFLLLWFTIDKIANRQVQDSKTEKEKITLITSQSKSKPIIDNKIQKVANNETQKVTENKTQKTAKNHEQQELQKFLEQQVQELLAQRYIDPLTAYIIKYQKDRLRKSYVQHVIIERNRRCAGIERLFQQRKKNYWTLAKLTTGYNYSCPDVVTRFAQRI